MFGARFHSHKERAKCPDSFVSDKSLNYFFSFQSYRSGTTMAVQHIKRRVKTPTSICTRAPFTKTRSVEEITFLSCKFCWNHLKELENLLTSVAGVKHTSTTDRQWPRTIVKHAMKWRKRFVCQSDVLSCLTYFIITSCSLPRKKSSLASSRSTLFLTATADL